jgi:Ion transport protein
MFNYLISAVILLNLIFLLMQTPTNNPKTGNMEVVKILDILCTAVFILEGALKIIALGFVNTSIEKQSPYLFNPWNLVDFFIIILAIVDLFAVN